MDDTERLDLVASALGGFVYDWDLVSGVVSRTAGVFDLLGYTAEEIANNADWWHERVHPDDLTRVEAVTRRAVNDPSVARLKADYRTRHADGTYRWGANHTWLVRDDTGRAVRLIGVTSDISALSLAVEFGLQGSASLADGDLLERERFARADAQAARDRMSFLQRLSADLTQTLTRASVTDVVVRHLVDAFGASAGSVVELSEDEREFILIGTVGFSDEVLESWSRWPVERPTLARDAMRTREPVFLRNRDEWAARFSRPPAMASNDSGVGCAATPGQGSRRRCVEVILRAAREPADEYASCKTRRLCTRVERAFIRTRERGRATVPSDCTATAVLAGLKAMGRSAPLLRRVRDLEASTSRNMLTSMVGTSRRWAIVSERPFARRGIAFRSTQRFRAPTPFGRRRRNGGQTRSP
jgi:PAS domain S-box-containing protein